MRAQQSQVSSGGDGAVEAEAGGGHDLRRMAQMKRAQERKKAAQAEGGGHEKGHDEPEQKKSPMLAMSGAIELIQHQVLPTWERAVDALDPAAIKAAGALAIGAWTDVAVTSSAEMGSPEWPGIEVLKRTAIGLLGKIGLRKFHGVQMAVAQEEYPEDPTQFIEHATTRAATMAEKARTLMGLLKSGPPDKKGKPGPPGDDAQFEIFRLLSQVQDPEDFNFLDTVAQAEGVFGTLRALKGLAGGIVDNQIAAENQHELLTDNGENPMTPQQEKRINEAADQIQKLVEDTTTADDPSDDPYLQILDRLSPVDRMNLLYLLGQRGLIHDMAHLGSDGVQQLINQTPEFGSWVIKDELRSHKTRSEKLEHAAVETAKQFPGAMMSMGAGAIDAFSDVPIIGGVAGAAADGIRDARDWTDDELGADPKIARVMNKVEGTAGRVIGEVGKVAIAGQADVAETAEAAKAYEVYKDVSAMEKIYSAINGLRNAWDEAPKIWHVVEPLLTNAVHLDFAALFGGDEAAIDGADGLLDTGIDELKKLAGAHLTEKGKEEAAEGDKKREEAPGERHKAEKNVQDPQLAAAVQNLQSLQQKASLPDADPKYEAAVEKQKEAIQQMLANQKNAEIAQGRAAMQKDEDDKKKAAAAPQTQGDPKMGDIGKQLLERLKELVIGALFGALKGFKDAFMEPLKKEAKGGPISKEKQKTLMQSGIAGAVKGFSEQLMEPATKALADLASDLIEKALQAWMPEASGITHIGEVRDKIEKLCEAGVNALDAKAGVERLLESALHLEEEKGPEEGGEGSEPKLLEETAAAE